MLGVVDLAQQGAHVVLLVVVGEGQGQVGARDHLLLVGGGRRPVAGEVAGEGVLRGEEGVADLAPEGGRGAGEGRELGACGGRPAHGEVLAHAVPHVLGVGQHLLPLLPVLAPPVLLQMAPAGEGAGTRGARNLLLVLSVLANAL